MPYSVEKRREYNKNRIRKPLTPEQKAAAKIRKKKWQAKNKEKVLAQKRKDNKKAYAKNKDTYKIKYRGKYADYMREYRENNRKKALEYAKEYQKRNKGRVNALKIHNNKKRKLRIVKWLTQEQKDKIVWFYEEAVRITKETGIEHQVDHIIPLCGKNVSGLHHPDNLQILKKEDNLKKSNDF